MSGTDSLKNISSHVLDTATGIPAAGMSIKLYLFTSTIDVDVITTDKSDDWLLIGILKQLYI